MQERTRGRAEDAWLPLALPVAARAIRTSDRGLAASLQAAGAEITTAGGDVEIGASSELTGDAACAIVTFDVDVAQRDRQSRLVRALARLTAQVHLRWRALCARWRLRRLGYATRRVHLWDNAHPLRLPEIGAGRRRPAAWLPRRAFVVGGRTGSPPTLFTAALAAASDAAGAVLRPEVVLPKSGVLVVLAEAHVLRVAVGDGAARIRGQIGALESISAIGPGPVLAGRLPRLVGSDDIGLATWAVESRLPGRAPIPPLSTPLLTQCLDFLVELHGLRPRPPGGVALREQAVAVAEACDRDDAELLRVAEQAEEQLADITLGVAHGDFFHGNLLCDGDRLVGVIDWDSAGTGRLPLLDLIHLQLTAARPPGSLRWGPAIEQILLPWADGGGDATAVAYCERVGVACTTQALHGFAVAYWLDQLVYQLTTYADRRSRPLWVERNVDVVLGAFRHRSAA